MKTKIIMASQKKVGSVLHALRMAVLKTGPAFEFTHEGRKIQFAFNQERSQKLAEIEGLVQEGNLAKAAFVIKKRKPLYNKETKSLKLLTVMAGTQYTNIWTTHWQTVLKMLLSFVTLWVVLQGNVLTEVDHTTGAGAVLRPVTFFVALASGIAPPTN
uniref:Uncharacterized protein n=1 Tax=Magallana gigas TaxID=29159 RepID=A0A8W8KUL0_MAGGI